MRALLVDDEKDRAQVHRIRALLQECNVSVESEYEFLGVIGANDFCNRVSQLRRPPDVAIIDYSLRWKDADGKTWNGDRVARFLRDQWRDRVPFYIIFVSAALRSMSGRYEQLVELLRVPYTGFVEFGNGWEESFQDHIRSAFDLGRAARARAIETLDREQVSQFFGKTLVGNAPSLLEVGHLAWKVSRTDATVLITGESGTGKELLARAIHTGSKRKERTFVKVNCANLPGTLLESELFGHERGAFTGADRQRIGQLETANGGTVFLDEIGEMDIATQAKLLSVLQDKEFKRLGSNRIVKVDVRIIAATNRKLSAAIEDGQFREDLYYRLNTIELEMPPLAQRGRDVLDLAEYFREKFARQHAIPADSFSYKARRAIEEYTWPGNVRELENAIERAVLVCDGGMIELAHLPPLTERGGKSTAPRQTRESWADARNAFKTSYFSRLNEECGGNVSKIARRAQMRRESVHQLLIDLGIHPRVKASPRARASH